MIATPFSTRLGLEHPIVSAPMGAVAGGRLAAAVSNAGGLGMVGGGYGEATWLQTELDLVRVLTRRPWGVGFITWSIQRPVFELALEASPAVVMLSFGNPQPYVADIKSAGCLLICQVQDLVSAERALEAGADVLVAQGTEGGGHGGQRATMALVPAVVDLAQSVPVIAAGGIADGRGLAAALMLGAQGALLGTRFYASTEALGHAHAKQTIANAQGDDTQRTQVFDIVRGYHWPGGYTGRALGNAFMRRWQGHEEELSTAKVQQEPAFRAAVAEGDYDTAMVWAGEAVDLIHSVEPAAAIVKRISYQAQEHLNRSQDLLSGSL